MILLIRWPVLPNARTVWCDIVDQLTCFTQCKDNMIWNHWSADLFYPMQGQYDLKPLISWPVSPNARTIWCDTVDQLTCFTQWKDYMMWYCWSADLFYSMKGQYDVIPLISWPVLPNARTVCSINGSTSMSLYKTMIPHIVDVVTPTHTGFTNT